VNFYSCSDTPSDLGSELIGSSNLIVKQIDSKTDSLKQYSANFKKLIPLGTAKNLIIGKNPNITSYILIKFNILLTTKINSDLDSLTVLSAKVKFTKSYKYGDSTALLDFSVHKIVNNWSFELVTADSLSKINYDQNDLSSNRSITDSITQFNIPSEIALNWLKDEKSNSSKNTYGLFLKPSSNTNRFIGFYSYNALSNHPVLELIVQKQGSYTDTLTFNSLSDAHIVSGNTQTFTADFLPIQSGILNQGKVWFDISSIPKNAIVNYASLTLTLDTLNSKFGSSYTDIIYVLNISDSVNNTSDETYITELKRSGNLYSGIVTGVVNKWIKDKSNMGLALKPINSTEGLELFVFYSSSAANYDYRPKLKITYTLSK
jgi:hypothetical protein